MIYNFIKNFQSIALLLVVFCGHCGANFADITKSLILCASYQGILGSCKGKGHKDKYVALKDQHALYYPFSRTLHVEKNADLLNFLPESLVKRFPESIGKVQSVMDNIFNMFGFTSTYMQLITQSQWTEFVEFATEVLQGSGITPAEQVARALKICFWLKKLSKKEYIRGEIDAFKDAETLETDLEKVRGDCLKEIEAKLGIAVSRGEDEPVHFKSGIGYSGNSRVGYMKVLNGKLEVMTPKQAAEIAEIISRFALKLQAAKTPGGTWKEKITTTLNYLSGSDNRSKFQKMELIYQIIQALGPRKFQEDCFVKASQIYELVRVTHRESVEHISEAMGKKELWTLDDIRKVKKASTQLLGLYSKEKVEKVDFADKIIEGEMPETSKDWSKISDGTNLDWFTDANIPIEIKRAIIRARLSEIRKNRENILDQENYDSITGHGKTYASYFYNQAHSWSRWAYEKVANSRELREDTKNNGYLDEVIIFFLYFVRNILGLAEIKVGTQADNEWLVLNYLNPLGHASSLSYSKSDDADRQTFCRETEDALAKLSDDDASKAKIAWLIEVSDIFMEGISAEMGKVYDLKIDHKYDDYIKNKTENDTFYLRKWFFRTAAVNKVVNWLFMNYKDVIFQRQKIFLDSFYVSYACFWSQYVKINLWNALPSRKDMMEIASSVFSFSSSQQTLENPDQNDGRDSLG